MAQPGPEIGVILRSFLFLCLVLAASCLGGTARAYDSQANIHMAIDLLDGWEKGTREEQAAKIDLLYRALGYAKANPEVGNHHRITVASIYYVGAIEAHIVLTQKRSGQTVDTALAQNAMDSLNQFLSQKENVPEFFAYIPNADSLMGEVAFALGDAPTAKQHWGACAAAQQLYCMNRLANAAVNEPGAGDDAIRYALDMRAKVIDAGGDHHCAGEHDALEMARLVYFTGIGRPGDSTAALLDKAKAFREQVLADKGKPPCDSDKLDLTLFMMAADRGEHQESLAENVEQNGASALWRQIAGHLRGKITDDALIRGLAGASTVDLCQAHFYAAWKAKQGGETDIAREHYRALLRLPRDDCNDEPLLLRRYLKLPVT